MIFGFILGIAILGAVIYLALDKKSDFKTRLVSLGALAVMLITVIICIIVYFTGNSEAPIDWSTYVVTDVVAEPEEDSGSIAVIIFSILFFLALFVVILALAMKEHKKNKPKIDGLVI